jgi:hypothetical protein
MFLMSRLLLLLQKFLMTQRNPLLLLNRFFLMYQTFQLRLCQTFRKNQMNQHYPQNQSLLTFRRLQLHPWLLSHPLPLLHPLHPLLLMPLMFLKYPQNQSLLTFRRLQLHQTHQIDQLPLMYQLLTLQRLLKSLTYQLHLWHRLYQTYLKFLLRWLLTFRSFQISQPYRYHQHQADHSFQIIL